MTATLHPLAPGFTFIQRGWLSGNHLVQAGPRPMLVDTGYIGHLDQTLDLIRQAGVEPAQVREIVTTHLHCDHVGAHAALHHDGGCVIAMSEPALQAARARDGLASWHEYYGQGYQWFPAHRAISPGEVVRIGELDWQAVSAPGHAGGQLAFFAPDTGWLISADAVWDGDFGMLTPAVEGWDAPFRQRETLARLAELKLTMVLPGHGPPIADGPAAIAACRQRIEAFIAEPRRQGEDQLRKALLYSVLMLGPLSRDELHRAVQAGTWLDDLCRRFFRRPPAAAVDAQMDDLIGRGLLLERDGLINCPLPA